MSDMLGLVLALFIGILLGVFFFGGLWWTVKKGVLSKRPSLWFLGSLIFRIAVTLSVFYFVSCWRPERMLACVGGFLIVNLTLKLIILPSLNKRSEKEAAHEN